MVVVTILLTALALSMDAFAVSVCKGLATSKAKPSHMCIAGAWFGGFQALMPLIGYFLGAAFKDFITAVDHWIAFALLVMIGVNMLREALSKEEECEECEKDANSNYGVRTMLTMAIATSIDAFAVGITFALSDIPIFWAVLAIGVITFAMSALGVKIGNVFGAKYKSKAELAGGIILVLLGVKFLLEGFGIL